MTNSLSENAALYPGEEIRLGAGYPALVKFLPGDVDKPLVVFITGGGVLARVAYGHPESYPPDFIAYWLQEKGYPFLALSYPIDNPVFLSVHPGFSVRDWGTQVSEIIDQHIDEDDEDRKVLVLAWSMAGRIAEPLTSALAHRKIAVELFVAMAASTALLGLQPALDQLTPWPCSCRWRLFRVDTIVPGRSKP
jgi:hypothetical protein